MGGRGTVENLCTFTVKFRCGRRQKWGTPPPKLRRGRRGTKFPRQSRKRSDEVMDNYGIEPERLPEKSRKTATVDEVP